MAMFATHAVLQSRGIADLPRTNRYLDAPGRFWSSPAGGTTPERNARCRLVTVVPSPLFTDRRFSYEPARTAFLNGCGSYAPWWACASQVGRNTEWGTPPAPSVRHERPAGGPSFPCGSRTAAASTSGIGSAVQCGTGEVEVARHRGDPVRDRRLVPQSEPKVTVGAPADHPGFLSPLHRYLY